MRRWVVKVLGVRVVNAAVLWMVRRIWSMVGVNGRTLRVALSTHCCRLSSWVSCCGRVLNRGQRLIHADVVSLPIVRLFRLLHLLLIIRILLTISSMFSTRSLINWLLTRSSLLVNYSWLLKTHRRTNLRLNCQLFFVHGYGARPTRVSTRAHSWLSKCTLLQLGFPSLLITIGLRVLFETGMGVARSVGVRIRWPLICNSIRLRIRFVFVRRRFLAICILLVIISGPLKVYFAVLIAVVIIHHIILARSSSWREIILDLVIDIIVVSQVSGQLGVGHSWGGLVVVHCLLVAVSTFRGCSLTSFLVLSVIMVVIWSRAFNKFVVAASMMGLFPLHKWLLHLDASSLSVARWGVNLFVATVRLPARFHARLDQTALRVCIFSMGSRALLRLWGIHQVGMLMVIWSLINQRKRCRAARLQTLRSTLGAHITRNLFWTAGLVLCLIRCSS